MPLAPKIPIHMSVAEFLDWDSPPPQQWQLVDGVPLAMAPASGTHAAIQAELARLIANHLAERNMPCRVLVNPGIVPHVQSHSNFRIPDLGVTCAPILADDMTITDPILLIEILSPSNQAETWANVWTYTTIPSVKEVLIVKTASVRADLLRRNRDGTWPQDPQDITAGDLVFESINFILPLISIYRTTKFSSSPIAP